MLDLNPTVLSNPLKETDFSLNLFIKITYHSQFPLLISLSGQEFVGMQFPQYNRYSNGLLTGRSGFDSRQRQDVSILHSVQMGSGVHSDFYPMCNNDYFPGGKAAGA
jgi:hypothetical protein